MYNHYSTSPCNTQTMLPLPLLGPRPQLRLEPMLLTIVQLRLIGSRMHYVHIVTLRLFHSLRFTRSPGHSTRCTRYVDRSLLPRSSRPSYGTRSAALDPQLLASLVSAVFGVGTSAWRSPPLSTAALPGSPLGLGATHSVIAPLAIPRQFLPFIHSSCSMLKHLPLSSFLPLSSASCPLALRP